MNKETTNPIIKLDFPDVDVIRVDDTYYMVSTTMHFMPGCEILRSYDLIHWELAAYVYDKLDSTDQQKLVGTQHIYGKGMWAASLRYHKGTFYVCFVANDTKKTYLYTATDITGPWKKQYIEGFYHDCSLLFDDDDRIYIVYGNKEIHLTELESDLSKPKKDGLNRVIVVDEGNPGLGYEGSHIYKINGKYYVFFIHSDPKVWKRIEACFMSDSLEGEFIGGDILNDDLGYHNQGVAQGGIVDTPNGEWYGILFQDRAAVGRIPVLVPMTWNNDFPVFGIDGKVPSQLTTKSAREDYIYEPLVGSDDFTHPLKSYWQWNHQPDLDYCSVDYESGCYRIQTNKLSTNVTQAVNTLTQRMRFPSCEAYVTVDGSKLRNGDYAGLCALQGCYGMIALTKENDFYYLSMRAKTATDESMTPLEPALKETEYAKIQVFDSKVTLKVKVNFMDQIDEAEFFYFEENQWKKIGITHKLFFKLDHFTGCRFGLFCYATKEIGGIGAFHKFEYVI